MEKKYILTNVGINYKGKILYRIKALKDFNDVGKGDLGGFVESYDNLSQEGDCWLYGYSKVYDNARVLDNAYIHSSEILDKTEIFGNAEIYGDASISDCKIFDNAKIYGNTRLWNSEIFGNSKIYGESYLGGCLVSGNSQIYDKAVVSSGKEPSIIRIYDNAKICGKAKIDIPKKEETQINICLDTNITKDSDIYMPKAKCHLKGDIIFFKDINNDICISLNWFKGTIDEFIKTIHSLKLNKTNINKYLNLIERAKNHIKV